MGSVLAAGPRPAATVNVPSPELVPPPPGPQQSQSSPVPLSPETLNQPQVESDGPGSFEDLHKKCKDLFPQVFEGGKLIISKGLSSHFQISHTLSLSTFQPSGYRFGSTYVGTKKLSLTESFPVIIGDIDVSGNLNANIIHAFTPSLRGKLVAQIQNSKCVASQVTTDYRGSDFTSSLTLGNIDPLNESGICVGQYLQRVSSKLDLGAELLYQYGKQVPGAEISILSLAARYTADKWALSANLSPLAGNLHACYYHQVSDTLQVGAELETSLRMQESVATVGYQVEIPSANVTFRGQFDTNWCIGAVMEKKLLPFPFTFALSGYANHVKKEYRFGVGLIVG